MKKIGLLLLLMVFGATCFSQKEVKIKKRDRKKDIEVVTTAGVFYLRLSDSTPLHRDNFLRMVKVHYYDSILFHRVIKGFMVQAGDPNSKQAPLGKALGDGGPDYTVPAEFVPSLFHRKGVLAAAREGDASNPKKASSASQFYIVQGRKFTDAGLDSVVQFRLKGRLIPAAHREVYKTEGGAPHLDQSYTIFGEVVSGIAVIDSIAATPTSKGVDKDRPLTDQRILSMRLVRRKNRN